MESQITYAKLQKLITIINIETDLCKQSSKYYKPFDEIKNLCKNKAAFALCNIIDTTTFEVVDCFLLLFKGIKTCTIRKHGYVAMIKFRVGKNQAFVSTKAFYYS